MVAAFCLVVVLSIPILQLVLFSKLKLLTHEIPPTIGGEQLDKIVPISITRSGAGHIQQPPQVYMLAVADESFKQLYSFLFDKMERYASMHGHTWLVLNTDPVCEEAFGDYFFRKHCIVAKWMENYSEVGDRIFVFDSDVAPYRYQDPLEHWLRFTEDVILYERTWNQEIMAGNYCVRNTKATRKFLMEWAAYEQRRPPGFSSADNGAIHLHLLRSLGFEEAKTNGACEKMYNNLTEPVTNMDPYWAYVACTRKKTQPGTYTSSELSVRILKRDTAWVMDGAFDMYGREGHGPAGVGPIFHHGVKCKGDDAADKMTREKYGMLLIENSKGKDFRDANTTVLTHSSAQCSTESENLGTMPSLKQCALAVSITKYCGMTFMFSESYPVWGCRCCVPDDPPNESGNANWNLFSLGSAKENKHM